MNNIELYIENNLVELGESLDYAITKNWQDLLNPTDIKTEYSKTIEIPFTPNNNTLFGNIYRLDKQITLSKTSNLYEYFDPTKKIDCQLRINGEVLFNGYMKMNSITNTNKKQSYNINIFGKLGLFLNELKKLSPNANLLFDTTKNEEFSNNNVTPVKYIENTGMSVLNMDRINLYNKYTIEFSINELPSTGKVKLFGEGEIASIAGQYGPINVEMRYTIDLKNINGAPSLEIQYTSFLNNTFKTITKDIPLSFASVHKLEFYGDNLYVDNQYYQLSNISIYHINLYNKKNIRLFYYIIDDGTLPIINPKEFFLGKIYRYEIETRGGNIYKYYPAYYGDNIGCLYDSTNNKIYESYMDPLKYSSELINNIYKYEKYIYKFFEPELLNSKFVQKSFTTSTPSKVLANNIHNKIGFTISNSGLNQSFDSKKVYQGKILRNNKNEYIGVQDNIYNFVDIIDGENNGISKDTAELLIGEGLLPRAFGEFRSYYQRPYIYCKQLIEGALTHLENITNFKVHYDPAWFNDTNPYWYNLVNVCKLLPINDNEILKTSPYTIANPNVNLFASRTRYEKVNYDLIWETSKYTKPAKKIYCDYKNNTSINGNLIFTFFYLDEVATPLTNPTQLSKDANYLITLTSRISNGNLDNSYSQVLATKRYQIVSKDSVAAKQDGYTRIIAKNYYDNSNNKAGFTIEIPINDVINAGNTKCFGNICSVYNNFYVDYNINIEDKIRYQDLPHKSPITDNKFIVDSYEIINNSDIKYTISKNYRSNRYIELADLLGDETIYDFILRYIKNFNLILYSRGNDIYIETYATYFKNYSISDFTNKVDRYNDYKITPITIDTKYFKMNYEDIDNYCNNTYKNKYNINYGELKLSTKYNFNNDIKNLFKGNHPYIGMTPSILDWDNMFNGSLKIITPDEISGCYYKQLDKKQELSDYNSSYAFWVNRNKFDKNIRQCYITDDTPFEINNNSYLYHIPEEEYSQKFDYKVDSYNLIDNMYIGQKSLMHSTYSIPSMIFTNFQHQWSVASKKGIYDECFKKYYDERYNLNNYKLDCYLYITPEEFKNFKFNMFITIDGVLFFINKIIDFNPTTHTSTKCELIKVTDINGYLNE